MYSFPSEGGKGPMKSIPQRSKISTSRIDHIGISSRLEMFNALDLVSTPYRNGGRPWRWWASRSRSARSCLRSCAPRNVLRTSMSDTSLRCLLAPLLVFIAGWSNRILDGIGVVLPKSSTWDHGRNLSNDDSNASGLIQSRWIWWCVHTRGRGSRWQGDARRGMFHRCLFLPKRGDAISGMPSSSRCPSSLWFLSRILEGAAPII